MALKDKFLTFPQYLIPQHFISRAVAKFLGQRHTWLKNKIISAYIKHYQVDMNEAAEPEPHAYLDFNHFFTRKLKPELRPIASASNAVSSPADGIISQLGPINNNQIIQAKNINYSLEALLADPAAETSLSQHFKNGKFMTIYLSPRDYHRVHMPIDGQLQLLRYVPGQLFSVNTRTAENVNNLFTRNERAIALFHTAAGPMAVVFVGAVIVAGIHTAWAGDITPNRSRTIEHWDYKESNIHFKRGEEIGYFKTGSTIIILFPEKSMQFLEQLKSEDSMQFGQLIGYLS